MSNSKGLVKSFFGLVLTILVIVGAAFGLDIKVDVSENVPCPDVADVGETLTEEQTENVADFEPEPVQDETEAQESTAESTTAADEEPDVDMSVAEDVTTVADEHTEA